MALLIGMDEAGYGPNLGPLVISATAWEVPGDPRKVDLWKLFAGAVEQSAPENDSHIHIADYKQHYSPAVGLNNLEAGVLSALAVWRGTANSDNRSGTNGECNRFPSSFREFFRNVAICPVEECDSEPWFAGADHLLEVQPNMALADGWVDRCRAHGIRLRAICADVVFTRRFNEETRRHDNKARAHSEMSMRLLRHV